MKKKLISLLDDSTVSRLVKIVSYIRARCIRPSRNWFYKTAQISRFPDVETQVLSHPERHLFFGYYDVSPFSIDDRYVLANLGPKENKQPDNNTQLSIGYFDRLDPDKGFTEIGCTETWGWQLGCRLQWYPSNSQSSVLYNKMVDNQYGCVAQDIESKKIMEAFPFPIFTVSHDGQWALSLNFSRLQRLRPGYGFVNDPDDTKDQLAPDRDGIWRIDLQSKKRELLFTLADAAAFHPHESMKGAAHYFNHLLFNPSAKRFLFMHFWTKDERRYSRLITCDLDGSDWFPIANEGHASHYTWKNDRKLIVYATHKNTGTHYYQYLDKTNERSIVGENHLTSDGHPTFSPDGRFLLVDTYPDKYSEQNVFLYTIKEDSLTQIGSFYNPDEYRGEIKCDLHPRWSPSGRFVCIDTACDNKRVMVIINIQKLL